MMSRTGIKGSIGRKGVSDDFRQPAGELLCMIWHRYEGATGESVKSLEMISWNADAFTAAGKSSLLENFMCVALESCLLVSLLACMLYFVVHFSC